MQLDQSLSTQTYLPAIDDLSNTEKYVEEILKHIPIDSLGILIDEKCKNIIFVLLKDKIPKSFFRILLNQDNTLTFIRALIAKNLSIYTRFLQGSIIDIDVLLNFEKLEEIWNLASSQEDEIKDENFIPKKIRSCQQIRILYQQNF